MRILGKLSLGHTARPDWASMRALMLVLAMVLSWLALPTSAQDFDATGMDFGDFDSAMGEASPVRAKLFAEQAAAVPGETVTFALELTHGPEWHTYWINPGTGYATSMKWDLPEGFEASEIRWPTPKRFVGQGGIAVGHGYEGVAYLLVDVAVPSDYAGDSVTFKGLADWLMCDPETCVPGSEPVSVTLPVGQATAIDEENIELFKSARAAMPASVTAADGFIAITHQDAGQRATLAIDLEPSGVKKAYFLTNVGGVLHEEAEQTFGPSSDEQALIINLEANPTTREPIETPSGVLRVVYSDGSVQGFAIEEGDFSQLKTPLNVTELIGFIGAAFVGGLILNLMPCVFPVLAIKIMGFVGQVGEDRRKIFVHGLVFGGGVMVSFWTLAAALLIIRAGGQQLGWGFQLQNPVFVGIMALLMLAIGLNLAGLFEIGTSVMAKAGQASTKVGHQGYSGSFFSGVLATALATPCSAPFMAPAVGAALTQPGWIMVVILTSLGLGLAIPYVILSAFPSWLKVLPKPGAWMETFKQVMAFPMFLVAIWLAGLVFLQQTDALAMFQLLLAGVVLSFGLWIYGRYHQKVGQVIAGVVVAAAIYMVVISPPVESEAAKQIQWEAFSPELVQQRLDEGRPVFVDFTADWCITCKFYERVAINTEPVIEAMDAHNVAMIKADWTKRDALIGDALAEYGRAAVPFYLFLSPDENVEPVTTDALLRPSDVVERFEIIAGVSSQPVATITATVN